MKKGRARPGRRILTLAIAAAMLLGLIVTPLGRITVRAAGASGPVVKPNDDGTYDVTFSYQSDSGAVELRGEMNDWSGAVMEPSENGDVYTCTVNLTAGAYAYKFKKVDNDSEWPADPNNPIMGSNGNSFVAVGYESPVIDGEKVTFKYINKNPNVKVYLAGSMPESSWAKIEMEESGGIYTYTAAYEPQSAAYEYKFVLVEAGKDADVWVPDPANTQPLADNGNSRFTVEDSTGPDGPGPGPAEIVSPEIDGNGVTFRYKDESGDVTSVELMGTVPGTDWEINGEPAFHMVEGQDGLWEITLSDIPVGTYLYKFVLNGGNWVSDPLNDQTVDDGSGGVNSVLTVPGGDDGSNISNPEIDGNGVTFRYKDTDARNVGLTGSMNGWPGDQAGTTPFENKGEGLWELTTALGAGYYEYKFLVDGTWTPDPFNPNKITQGDGYGNAFFTVTGLAAPAAQTVEAGKSITLPAALTKYSANGGTSDVEVEYKIRGDAHGAAIEGTKLTVPAGFSDGSIALTASDGEYTVDFTVSVVRTLYTYNIYFFDWDASRMSTEAADMHVWEVGGGDIGDLPFSGTVQLAGKTWLKGTITTAATSIGVIPRSRGGWTWQTSDHTFENTGRAEELNVYIVMGDEATYFELPTLPEAQGREFYVPSTFPGPSWDAGSNKMEMIDGVNRIYSCTFKNVPAASYEFKISVNASWDENYGVGGKRDGSNYSVTVPETMDVTVYYSDKTHHAVTSVTYRFIEPTVSGGGIEGLVLTDAGLTGIYSGTVRLEAGTYSGIALTSPDGKIGEFASFELNESKDVTFYYAAESGVWYCSAIEWQEAAVTYDSKDLQYKAPFGAVPTGTPVTFAVETTGPVTGVMLVVGSTQYEMTDESGAGGAQRWSVTTSFPSIGEYKYYFLVTQAGGVRVYCDDDGYYGTGVLTELTNVKPYDLVVYEDGYKTPDWMKDAVIYQIFPDRFFNGDEGNDHAQETARGAVHYEYPAWDRLPSNPEQQTAANKAAYEALGAFWGDGEWANDMYGGDLAGITEKVEYLKSLGVTVIYLNPVFASISNHRYDTTDYTKLDPLLGDLEDFRELVRAAYANGMHIILDGVFNHVSDDSVYFDRYYKFLDDNLDAVGAYPYWAYVYDYMAENGVSQAVAEAAAKEYFTETYGVTDFSYTQWFRINNEKGTYSDTIGERAGELIYTYEGWWGYDSMPVIKSTNGSEYQSGNWAEAIIDGEDSVSRYWLEQGSNGWRLDVANEVSDETWQKFRQAVKEESGGDAVIIGEIWDDAARYLMGDMYDSVMNYMFRDAVTAYAKGGSSQQAMKDLEKLRERYPEEAFYAMMNLVDSHDTARIVSYLDGIDDDRNQKDLNSAFPLYETTSQAAKDMQKLVAFLQFTYAGAPTVYYGDERGMAGADDPDDRRTIDWSKVTDQTMLDWYTRLGQLRADYSALRTGSVEPIDTGNVNILGYVRRDEAQTIIVLANNDASDKTVTLSLEALGVNGNARVAAQLRELISGADVTVGDDGTITVTVPARSGVVITGDAANPEETKPLPLPDYDAMDKEEQPTPPTPPAPPTPPVTVDPVDPEPVDPVEPQKPDVPPEENLPGEEPPKTDLPDEEPPKTDLPDEEPPKMDLPDEEPPKTDLPGEEPPKTDLPDEEPPKTDLPDNGAPGDETPKTGDASSLTVWIALMALSAAGLAVTAVLRRKSRRS